MSGLRAPAARGEPLGWLTTGPSNHSGLKISQRVHDKRYYSQLLARKLGRSFLGKGPQPFGPVLGTLQDYIEIRFQPQSIIQR